ncbi:hypothetical protein [Nostoc sp.]|uniref:hypothetical protein n=1 Tax=Nostoc sp. TaxID=1180 RepID=UPI002FFCD1EB
MYYYLTLGQEFLTNRDAKRAKEQFAAGENSICQPDFNKGQLLPAVLLLENRICYSFSRLGCSCAPLMKQCSSLRQLR